MAKKIYLAMQKGETLQARKLLDKLKVIHLKLIDLLLELEKQ